ncbi:MAG: hypothetical protein ACTHKX_03930 [Pseudolysinimonas sp.]
MHDARAQGVSRGRLGRDDLARPFHGIRVIGDADAFVPRCRALATVFDDGMAFCGSTAARLWELPLPASVPGVPLRVSSLAPTRALRRQQVVGSQRACGSPVLLDGIPVLDAVSTFLALGRELTVADLTAVADRLISGTAATRPISSREELGRALSTFHGRGARALRVAVRQARDRVWSRPKTLLRLLCADAGLPAPTPNLEVLGGESVIDLAWPEFGVGVEYQGRWHDATPAQRARDAHRRERLVDEGWTMVEVRSADLFVTPHALVVRLVQRLVRAGWVTAALDLTVLPRYTP